MYDQFFSKAHELLSEGMPFATAVVVRAEKPTSGKPGDKAIITPTGVMHGWIGGSCAQPTVIEQALKAMADGEPRLIRLSVDPEPLEARTGVLDLPMTCFSGGTPGNLYRAAATDSPADGDRQLAGGSSLGAVGAGDELSRRCR